MLHYWDEFRRKFGFNDGESVPSDAYERRNLYVRFVNEVAERVGSTVRCEAFDRGGCHNPWMIVLRNDANGTSELGDKPDFEPDEKWQEVIKVIEESDACIDDALVVTASVDETEYQKVLSQLSWQL